MANLNYRDGGVKYDTALMKVENGTGIAIPSIPDCTT
jgi:hypothetical protein